jgi:uncharacterized protein (TIGR02246 family)
MQKDEQAIRNLVDTWLAATKTGDLATVLNLMAEDVVFMVPGKEPFGKESFTASAKDMRNFHVEGTSDIQELRDCGDHHIVRRTEIVRKLLPGAAIVWCDQ